jgi:hypothetical protein
MMGSVGSDGAPGPASFTAMTLNSYLLPSMSPVTVKEVFVVG